MAESSLAGGQEPIPGEIPGGQNRGQVFSAGSGKVLFQSAACSAGAECSRLMSGLLCEISFEF